MVPIRIAAKRRYIKRRVVEQVFELPRQFRTVLGSRRRWHVPQIEIVSRFRIVARVAGFQKLEDGFLRCAPPKRILGFRSGGLRAEDNGEQQCGQ